jgi:hypothetical protein
MLVEPARPPIFDAVSCRLYCNYDDLGNLTDHYR